jgi:hypothetical protein
MGLQQNDHFYETTNNVENEVCTKTLCAPALSPNVGSIGLPKTPTVQTNDNWKHRLSRMKCDSCMWYVQKDAGRCFPGQANLGRCRRHAPTMSGFPAVYGQDWCGDHKLDENKA